MDPLVVVLVAVVAAAAIGIAVRNLGANSTLITRTREPIAIVLLLIGIMLFAVGWLVGVILLWSSPIWRLRDKFLGTLVVPGGLPMGVIFATWGLGAMLDRWSNGAMVALCVVLAPFFVFGPIFTSFHLARRFMMVRKRAAVGVA